VAVCQFIPSVCVCVCVCLCVRLSGRDYGHSLDQIGPEGHFASYGGLCSTEWVNLLWGSRLD
jgi:hypothetical protein